jgi:hypothetical protein
MGDLLFRGSPHLLQSTRIGTDLKHEICHLSGIFRIENEAVAAMLNQSRYKRSVFYYSTELSLE